MSRIGVMMSTDRADGQMSSHFGKAEWIMATDSENGFPEFVKNEALNGRSAVEAVIRQGCTDVILTEIGDGALGHLQTAHIRAWAVPNPVAGKEALRMFAKGQLSAVSDARTATNQGARHGCCCSSHNGSDVAPCRRD